MNTLILSITVLTVGLLLACSAPRALADEPSHLNVAAFGRLLAWNELGKKGEPPVELASLDQVPAQAKAVGIEWDEPRDVREVRVRFTGAKVPDQVTLGKIKVQYWFETWPPPPPHMPTIEDEIDDPWRGKWLTAQSGLESQISLTTHECTAVLTFKPLAGEENPRADHLPRVPYRRTLKVRLMLPEGMAKPASLEVFSDSVLKPLAVRIELGCKEGQPAVFSGRLEVFNGKIVSVKPWNFAGADVFESPGSWTNVGIDGEAKGIIAELLACEPAPAGSNDITVVTVRAEARIGDKDSPRTFSFNTADLKRGPIYVPDLHAYVTRADDPKSFDAARFAGGKTIREQIPTEPEQSYERAAKEIPEQDPWVRQGGDMVYLPAAADASWQKFAVQYSGNIFISRGYTKAFGAEKKRLRWPEDNIHFRLGTGSKPYFRDDHKATMAVTEEDLPIMLNRWECDGLSLEQESFATLLEGPLDPNDPARSEQTPAVLMIRLTARNIGSETRRAHFWFKIEPGERVQVNGKRVMALADGNDKYDPPILRAVILPPEGARVSPVNMDNAGGMTTNAATCQYDVPAGASQAVVVHIPFVSDVRGEDAKKLESLSYDRERQRVYDYWKAVIDRTTRFSTPDPKFNYFARFVVPHIRISTTKDPKSGLYMVPAASYGYRVYANEACFQVLMLDALGDTKTGGEYLDTFVKLQGSRPFPGNYTGSHDGVYHGAKVNDEYDYTASDYNLDHGTTLWTLGRHYFYTRDKAWLERTLPSMFKAVEWIERQRKATQRTDVHGKRILEYGLLPAGHIEDNADWGYWYSINAYCVAGMQMMARAMADIGREAEAKDVAAKAEAYRQDLRAAVLRTAEVSPVVRMRDGTYSPYVSTRARQKFRQFGPLQAEYYSRYNKPADVLPCYRLSGTREVLYGPMILLDTEIIDPYDTVAGWILDDWEDNLTLSGEAHLNVHGFTDEKLWFSQGGMVWQSNLQNPILAYLKRNEAPAAIRNLYNNFVACLYREVNTFTEEYRMWGHASGPFYKSPDEARFVNRLRDMLVLESGDELWLASGAPRRWLADKQGIRVDRLNSYFGELSFSLRAGDQPDTVVGRVDPPTRNKPGNLWLYVRLPDHKKIAEVKINGQPCTDIDAKAERIRLPQTGKPLDIVIRYCEDRRSDRALRFWGPDMEARKSTQVEALGLALVLVIASHAVPSWLMVEVAPGPVQAVYRSFGLHGYLNLYCCLSLLLPVLLCIGAPSTYGLKIGDWGSHRWRVLAVTLGPVVAVAAFTRFTSQPFADSAIGIWLISPAAQDVLFSGYVYTLLRSAFPGQVGRWVRVNQAIFITALFFCLWHTPNFLTMDPSFVWFQILYTFLAGICFLLGRQWTGSILPGLASHMACNFLSWTRW